MRPKFPERRDEELSNQAEIGVFAAQKAMAAAGKTAAVVLHGLELANAIGGKGVAILSGTLADVHAAVERGRADEHRRGLLARAVVIPRMDARLRARIL